MPRRKAQMITYSGKAVFPEVDARHTGEMPTLEDVARGLSAIIRFAGQTEDQISVAEHSIFVSYLCNPRFALLGLLHDAAEAIVGDCVGTWKTDEQSELEHQLCLKIIDSLRKELQLDDARFDYYFRSDDAWEDVAIADKAAVATEAQICGHAAPQYFPEQCGAYGRCLDHVLEAFGRPGHFISHAHALATAMIERSAKLEGVFDPEPVEAKPSLVTW